MVMPGNCPVQVVTTARTAHGKAAEAQEGARRAGGTAVLALGLGGAAGVLAAIALAKKAEAAGGGVIDDATRQLLMAIAEANAQLVIDVEAILAAMPVGGVPGGGGEPIVVVTPNAVGIQTASLVIDSLTGRYQLPDMIIPDGMRLLIRSWPAPINTGIIYVAQSKDYALDIDHIYPLGPGEIISYQVKNASAIFVSGTVVGDRIAITSEKA